MNGGRRRLQRKQKRADPGDWLLGLILGIHVFHVQKVSKLLPVDVSYCIPRGQGGSGCPAVSAKINKSLPCLHL